MEVEAGLHIGSEAWQEALNGFKVALGMADFQDCFHRYRQPSWLSEYFALPPLKASELGRAGSWLGGEALGPDTLVWPCPGSLCMGFSWSLFFVQRANEIRASLAPFTL